MFRKKKSSESGLAPSAERRPVPRGRDAAGAGPQASGAADNPLARRFRPEREPATVDLTAPARFQASSAASEDPRTAELQIDAAKLARVVSCDPQTGKFYIHPGHPGGAGDPVGDGRGGGARTSVQGGGQGCGGARGGRGEFHRA